MPIWPLISTISSGHIAAGPPVSFAAPAAPASKVLANLGKAIGITLEADKTAAAQVLLIQVSGVSQESLLKEISTATGAHWSATKTGFRLAYRATDIKELWSREAKYRSARFAKTLASLSERIEKDGSVSDLFAQGKGAGAVVTEDTNPGTTLGAEPRGGVRAAARLGADVIGDIRPGERVVFSTVSNPNQRALPRGFDSVGASLSEETRMFRTNYDRQFGAAKNPPPSAPVEIQRTLIILTRSLGSDPVYLHILAQGKNPSQSSEGWVRLTPSISPRVPAGTPLGQFKPTQEMTQFGRRVGDDGDRTSESGLVSGIACNPEQNDPLELALGKPLAAFARAKGKGLVACLPDSSFSPAIQIFKNPVDLNAFASRAEEMDLKFQESDDIVVSPLEPGTSTFDRTDRPALGRLMRSIRDRGGLCLEAVGDFSLTRKIPGELYGLEMAWMQGYDPSIAYGLWDKPVFGGGPAIHVWQRLSVDEISAMAKGPVALSTLSDSSRAAIKDWVLNRPVPTTGWGPGRGSDYLFQPGVRWDFSDMLFSDNPAGTAQLRVVTEDRVILRKIGGPYEFAAAPRDVLQYCGKDGRIDPTLAAAYTFRPGIARSFFAMASLNFPYPDGSFGSYDFSAAMSDETATAGSAPGPYASLPKALRDKIEGSH